METFIDFSMANFNVFNASFRHELAFAPFFNISRSKYHELCDNQNPAKSKTWDHIDLRLNSSVRDGFRGAVSGTSFYATKYFPAYRFISNTYMSTDWLSEVDWKKFQRDHILHQYLTMYICMTLLEKVCFTDDGTMFLNSRDKNDKAKNTLLDKCVDEVLEGKETRYLREYFGSLGDSFDWLQSKPRELQKIIIRQAFKETLLTASLFHDIGYPWQFTQQIEKEFGRYEFFDIPEKQRSDKIYELFRNKLIMMVLNGYSREEPQLLNTSAHKTRMMPIVTDAWTKTHGFPGAITYLYLNGILQRYPDKDILTNLSALKFFCGEWAAVGMMMHDMAKIYKPDSEVKHKDLRVSFKKDPLSFILTIADLIQDFNRPNVIFEQNDHSRIVYQTKCEFVRLNYDDENKELSIIYYFRRFADYNQKIREFIPKEQELFFNLENGYIDCDGLNISRIKLDAQTISPNA